MDSAFLEDIPKRELVNLCVKLNITKSKYKSKPRSKIAEIIIKRLLDNNPLTQPTFVENYTVVLPYPNEMHFTSPPNPSELYIPPRPLSLSIPLVYPRTMAYPAPLAYPTSTEEHPLLTYATPMTPITPDTPDTLDTQYTPITPPHIHDIQMLRRPRTISPSPSPPIDDDNTTLQCNVKPEYKYKTNGIVRICYDLLSIFLNPTILCIFLDPLLYCINNIRGIIQWWIEVWCYFLNPNTYISQLYDLMSYIEISFYRNVGMFILFTCLFVALYICLFWSICFNLIILIYYFGIK